MALVPSSNKDQKNGKTEAANVLIMVKHIKWRELAEKCLMINDAWQMQYHQSPFRPDIVAFRNGI